MESACLSADACSKKCVLDLRQRTKPTRTAHESHPRMLRDLSDVIHAGDERYEQAPSLNQELEEKIAGAPSWMVAHVREGAGGSAPAAREGCGHAGWRQETPCLYLRHIFIYLFLLLLVGVISHLGEAPPKLNHIDFSTLDNCPACT